MKIDRPGVFAMTADVYHSDPVCEPSLSSSIAKLLVTPGATPMHARHECPRLNPDYEADDSEKFDLGKAAHSLILHDPQAFEIIDAADWRTKAAQSARDTARSAGKIPILAHQFVNVTEMVAAACVQLLAHEDGRAFFVKGDGVPEQTMVWREGDVWCRSRLDWRPNTSRFFPDYKSTGASADPDCWTRTMYGMGADLQAAFYLRGIKALKLCDRPEFRFVVQENYAPFALSVIGLMPGALELANRQVERAIGIWADCRRDNRWPGYPRRTAWIDAPAWHEASLMAREVREHDASQDELRRARESQAPL